MCEACPSASCAACLCCCFISITACQYCCCGCPSQRHSAPDCTSLTPIPIPVHSLGPTAPHLCSHPSSHTLPTLLTLSELQTIQHNREAQHRHLPGRVEGAVRQRQRRARPVQQGCRAAPGGTQRPPRRQPALRHQPLLVSSQHVDTGCCSPVRHRQHCHIDTTLLLSLSCFDTSGGAE